ncbi:hypothetical protein BDZ94DRAFT_1309622 [Collybia nuda]|uniref:Uncharacterized protein n=1 Tax=Collybia nuda TaxID=64659 RepID=A0A9P5Y4H7_9AGAR|nr:hypothetical protein BDZ94DRAFT_1309622 [Collybia nuda]
MPEAVSQAAALCEVANVPSVRFCFRKMTMEIAYTMKLKASLEATFEEEIRSGAPCLA